MEIISFKIAVWAFFGSFLHVVFREKPNFFAAALYSAGPCWLKISLPSEVLGKMAPSAIESPGSMSFEASTW
jgi:hypothetical protein